MAGMIIPLWNKKSWNFDNLTASTSETHVAVKAVASERYTEAMLVVRAHTRDIVNASSKIEIVAFTTAPSGEDPSVDFFSSTASGTATIGNGSTSMLATAALANFGGFLRIQVIGTRNTSGNCNAELSADIVMKE